MEYPKDRNIHRLPHLLLNHSKYFLVARTWEGRHYFDSDFKKQFLYDCIMEATDKFGYQCDCWVILNNHYQLVLDVDDAKKLPLFIKQVNGGSSRKINKYDNCEGRKVWWQYWDSILDTEENYWTHVNYNLHNPVKHGYVKRMEDYIWSDFKEQIEKCGAEAVYERFDLYPVRDFTPPDAKEK
jgi:putative transposase